MTECMKNRMIGEPVDLNYSSVRKFFEERGENDALENKYNYVLFQDQEPELAVRRDREEKAKIGTLLSLDVPVRVLDIGCGIGRWGEYLLERGAYYVGIDGSAKMIEHAEANLGDYPAKKLLTGVFQDLPIILEKAGETVPFDLILVNGVFMYLNDVDFQRALKVVKEVGGKGSTFYIKESMSIEQRLTLNNFFSDGLKQYYSAIYRSVKEYRDSFQKAFVPEYILVQEGALFDEELRNHKETIDYYFIWKRQ